MERAYLQPDTAARALPESGLDRIAVLIPVYQPDGQLRPLVESLLERSFSAVIVVNDGSDREHDHVFEELAADCRTRVVRHAVNLGKGRALKTGLNTFLNHYPDFTGVVTCDADGQHTADDICATAKTLASNPGKLVLGARQFQGDVPLRSRLGNTLTRYIFGALTGTFLADTQTGLRGIPARLIPRLLRLDGERYDYEINVLADAAHSCGLIEVPIQTIYLDGNRSSHFNPVWDSMKIYFVLVRFWLSSLVASGIDFVVFSAVFWATGNVLTSMIAGRVSSLANFFLNRRFVFDSRNGVASALVRYYGLVALIAAASYSGIQLLSQKLGMNVLLSKILVETLLSLVSFSIQRTFVFDSGARESSATD